MGMKTRLQGQLDERMRVVVSDVSRLLFRPIHMWPASPDDIKK